MKKFLGLLALLALLASNAVFSAPKEEEAPPQQQLPPIEWFNCQDPGSELPDEVFGSSLAEDIRCNKPCVREHHILQGLTYKLIGVITTPVTPGTWNGLDHSRGSYVPELPTGDNPLISDEERKNARMWFGFLTDFPERVIDVPRGNCGNGCVCYPNYDENKEAVRVPDAQPDDGEHTIEIHGGSGTAEDGTRYIKKYRIKIHSRRTLYQGTCKGAWRLRPI